MFTTSFRGGKTSAAEQKIIELKSRISKLNAQKLKISLTKMILSSASNMSNVRSEKYGLGPEEIEKKSLCSERFRTLFNFHRIDRLSRYDNKKSRVKRRNLREYLNIGEKVLVLAERFKKKSTPGKFNKQSVQNIAYFNNGSENSKK